MIWIWALIIVLILRSLWNNYLVKIAQDDTDEHNRKLAVMDERVKELERKAGIRKDG